MRNKRENAGFPDDLRLGTPDAQAQPNQIRRMPTTNPDQVFFHLDFVRALQMHRTMAISILVTSLLLAGAYMAKRWNTYKSEALIYVQPSPHHVLENGPPEHFDANTYESYIQQQVHDVTRPDVLAAGVKKLPGFRGGDESEQSAADRLGSDVEVVRVGTAYQISITATASSAEEAAQIANAVATSYIDGATREQRAGDPQRIQLLSEERDRILKELGGDRTEQEDLNRKLGVAAVASTPDPYDDQIAETRAELVKARTANDEAAAKLGSLASKSATNAALDAEADELVAADPGLVSMKTALNKRKSDLISQMANLTPNHPQYKQDAEELAKINSSLETMSKELRAKASVQIEQKLKNDLERTSSVEARLNGQLAQLTSEAGSATPRLQRSNELATDIQRLRNRFTTVDEQFRNLTMENNAPGAVYLASAAQPPLHAARAKVFRNTFILLLAGLVLALGSALVAHNLDPRVYIATDVERVLGFPPMAQLPDLYEVGTGVAEEYMLRLAAAVEHAHQQGILSSCIFTGVAPGAGVTTVSTRVSSMLEAMGRETVLVDAVGAPPPAASAVSPGTDLVHAPRGSRSTALLQQMTQETDENTIVVTDTAPLLVSGETEYLARFVDSAIVVIESGTTTKAQLREVAQNLKRLEVSSVGFVLNRIALKNANPAFRESVHAVETHLRLQARAFDRPGAKAEPPVEHASAPAPAPTAPSKNSNAFDRLWTIVSEPEPAHAGNTEPAYAVETTSVAGPEPQPELQNSAAAKAYASVAPAFAVETAAAVPAVPVQAPAAPEKPAAAAAAPEPMWTVAEPEPVKLRNEYRTPASGYVARPMRGRETVRTVSSQQRAASPAPSEPVAEDASLTAASIEPAPIITPVSAPVMQSPAAEAWNAVESPAPAAPFFDPEMTLAATAPSSMPASEPMQMHQTASVPAPDDNAMAATPADGDELPYSAASRLGGLRNLLVSLGVKNLHKEAELRHTPEPELKFERLPERSVFAQPDTPEAEGGQENSAPALVKARPEIIPPRLAVVEPADRDKDLSRPVKSPQVSRWDSPDDVETLPSQRGQYRKRR